MPTLLFAPRYAAPARLLYGLLMLAPGVARADDANTCPAAGTGIPARPAVDEAIGPDDIYITADEVEASKHGVSRLTGRAEITRGRQQVRADSLEYHKEENTADLDGNIEYWDDDVYLHSGGGSVDFDNETATAHDTEYRLVHGNGHGHAGELSHEQDGLSHAEDVQYTTCPETDATGAPATPDWTLNASEMELDHEKRHGTAKNVVIRVKDVPVLYSPFISFPLSRERKSGFLVPSIGSSSKNGVDIRLPYYWNIAPDMDATITPRILTDNGVMPMGEFRYLLDRGQGEVNVAYLPGDDNYNDRDRNYVSFIHDQGFSDTGRLFLTFNRVSDSRYFEDFGTQLSQTSVRFLERRADVGYLGDWWSVRGLVQDYQTIDQSIPDASRPYTRLPVVSLMAAPLSGPNRINASIESEFSYFVRDDAALLQPDAEGARFDVYPSVSYPLRTASGFFTPRVGLRFTQYDLDRKGQFVNATPDRLLPVASVDAGLFFERDMQFAGRGLLQTLEPRAYYLYIPDQNQDNLPVFDSGIYNLSWDSLFREDRFTGPDRIGDANQVTLAVASRVIDPGTGRELGLFRIGQAYLFANQNVLMRGFNALGQLVDVGAIRTDTLGPLVTEFRFSAIPDWNLGVEYQWDPERDVTEKLAVSAQFLPGDGRVLNLAYRTRRSLPGEFGLGITDIEQSDLSFRWPLNPRWSVVGRWNYAIPEDKTLELFAGVEYESCCWGIRAVGRRFLTNVNGGYQTGVFLQVELKGLAGIGKKTAEFLSQRIPGYESEF